jgi:hypothetical protein
LAHPAAHDRGGLRQRFVTGLMTVAVVDALEVIDVDQQHGER